MASYDEKGRDFQEVLKAYIDAYMLLHTVVEEYLEVYGDKVSRDDYWRVEWALIEVDKALLKLEFGDGV